MEQEQYQEFLQLQHDVIEKLRASAYRSPGAIRRLHFIMLPAFGNPTVWEVFEKRKRRQVSLELSCTRWNRDVDRQAFETPIIRLRFPRPFAPTIESHAVAIDAEVVDDLLKRLGQASVPLAVTKSAAGVDGVTFELEVCSAWCCARISWWVHLPSEWAGLQPILDDFIAKCAVLLPDEDR